MCLGGNYEHGGAGRLRRQQQRYGQQEGTHLQQIPGTYSDLFEKGVKPILEKKGYKITGKDMSDLLQADIALNEGEVDLT